ncbi:uncharacterized protein ARMOST_16617 [Armillaria ostoyae]|uniref:Major facilitator superfamily (MFS) profile domain-containing protein n=1 Tax=Armillaria ostoyae TaxID=47428 RepID=A0A284RWN3_ARMOS|nr:uncharacterized protein ARMOST_16617 [Armillaria ostoyae]
MDITEDTAFMQRPMFVKPAVYRRALIVDCGLQAFPQFCGFNAVVCYSSTLFASIGFNQPTAVGLIMSGTTFLFAVALFRAERVGRRRILVFTHLAMIFETFASISFYCQWFPIDLTIHTCGELTDGTNYFTTWFAVVLLSTIILAAFYSTGLGNVPSQSGELFA